VSGGNLWLSAGGGRGSGAESVILFRGPQSTTSGTGIQDVNYIAKMYADGVTSKNFMIYAADDITVDYFNISTGVNAATTITTTDGTGGGGEGDLTFDIDGDITLDSSTGIIKTGSTTFVNNSGVIQVANQSNITGLGTISSGTWQGTAVADAYVANDLTISGGTVNDSVIGGSTPAAITGTTIDANTDFTVGSTVITDDQIQFTPSSGDTATITASSHGAISISTADASGYNANISLSPDGEIRLTPGTNKIWEIFDFHTTNFENTYSSGHYSGKILRHSNDSTALNVGQLYYLRSNGVWVSTSADDDGGGGPGYGDHQMLGVGLGNPQSVGVLIEGFVRIPYTEILNVPGSGAVDGLPIYVSTTEGHFDFTAPSDSGDFVRIVGYAIDDYTDSGNTDVLIYFNPSKTYIEIA